ncbi:MAG: glycosyltransferase family 2 protein [Bacteroidales bacterium]|nr:glycosyltransferase family 2 protein [Bacteroidales bacterium]
MKTKVAVVILNWNGRNYLQQFLPKVIGCSDKPEYKIVIVDNCSADDSVEYVIKNFPEVSVINFSVNHGFARGYALSLPQIEAEYYVLLNSDVEVSENWLDPIVQLLDNNPDIAAVMPKIKSQLAKEYFEYAGAGGGFIDKFGYPFCQGRILTSIEKDTGQYDEQREVFWASGACMVLRSSAYSKTGGLDGEFFAHMEEIDLCWRLKRLGYKIYYCPKSVVYHVGGGTLPNDNPRKLYYNYRNSLFLLFKNLNRGQFITIFIPRVLLDIISSILYLLQGKFIFCMSVLRAHIRFYLSLGILINKRRIFNKIIAKNSVGQIYNGSIVYDFFIRKVRKFSDLKF